MPETLPEAAPVDAEAAYEDPRSAPLSEAWKLIEPAPAPQERVEAIKAHLGDATLALLALPYPPRLGDKPLHLSSELLRLALEHPTVDLSLAADELVTGDSRRGELHFIQCRVIRSEHVASVQPGPGENEPVTLDDFARFFAALETLPEKINAIKDELRADETPPATIPRLKMALVDLFMEDEAWESADAESLGHAVADRDPRFHYHYGPKKHGRWKKKSLEQRIRELIVEAKNLAAEQRAGDP